MFKTVSLSIGGTSSCKDSNSLVNSKGYKSTREDAICPNFINVGPSSIICSLVHAPNFT